MCCVVFGSSTSLELAAGRLQMFSGQGLSTDAAGDGRLVSLAHCRVPRRPAGASAVLCFAGLRGALPWRHSGGAHRSHVRLFVLCFHFPACCGVDMVLWANPCRRAARRLLAIRGWQSPAWFVDISLRCSEGDIRQEPLIRARPYIAGDVELRITLRAPARVGGEPIVVLVLASRAVHCCLYIWFFQCHVDGHCYNYAVVCMHGRAARAGSTVYHFAGGQVIVVGFINIALLYSCFVMFSRLQAHWLLKTDWVSMFTISTFTLHGNAVIGGILHSRQRRHHHSFYISSL